MFIRLCAYLLKMYVHSSHSHSRHSVSSRIFLPVSWLSPPHFTPTTTKRITWQGQPTQKKTVMRMNEYISLFFADWEEHEGERWRKKVSWGVWGMEERNGAFLPGWMSKSKNVSKLKRGNPTGYFFGCGCTYIYQHLLQNKSIYFFLLTFLFLDFFTFS